MILTLEHLIACGVKPTQARTFLPILQINMDMAHIDTPVRVCAFLAQAIYESEGFTHLEENLYYSTPERIRQVFSTRVRSLQDAEPLARNPKALANFVYADRGGNGNFESGEGWLYRGRGIFQLTFKENYAKCGVAMAQPYMDQPDLVLLPDHAVATAAWYWTEHDCNTIADSLNFNGTTKAINPGMAGWQQRFSLYQQARSVIS